VICYVTYHLPLIANISLKFNQLIQVRLSVANWLLYACQSCRVLQRLINVFSFSKLLAISSRLSSNIESDIELCTSPRRETAPVRNCDIQCHATKARQQTTSCCL